jgi:23S rRNA (guanosine2251-2'-O)-methyltransferase
LGLNPVLAALRARGAACLELRVARGLRLSPNLEAVLTEARRLGLPIKATTKAELERLDERHQGVALLRRPGSTPGWPSFRQTLPSEGPALVLALDHLEDPRNLGALLRSAAAFGALAVVVPKDRSAPLSQAARAASAGASEYLPLVRTVNLARTLNELKEDGFWLAAAEGGQGVPLGAFDFPERCALILGGEGRGLSRAAAQAADWLVQIPLAPGPVNSLNVSCAGAVLMHGYALKHGFSARGSAPSAPAPPKAPPGRP